MGVEETYNTKIYTLRGGNTAGVKSDGQVNVHNGAKVNLGDETFSTTDLKTALINVGHARTINGGDTQSIPDDVTYLTVNASNILIMSLYLPSGKAGQELFIKLGEDLQYPHSTELKIYNDNGKVYGIQGSIVSLLWTNTFINSSPNMQLTCFKVGDWSITSFIGNHLK